MLLRSGKLLRSGIPLAMHGCGGDSNGPDPAGPAVASVTVLPSVDSIILGDTGQFHAEVRDSSGNPIDGPEHDAGAHISGRVKDYSPVRASTLASWGMR